MQHIYRRPFVCVCVCATISQLIIADHFWYTGVVVVGIEREREIVPFTQFWVSNWGGIEIDRIGQQGNLHVNSA
jgi:hypothetical protein